MKRLVFILSLFLMLPSANIVIAGNAASVTPLLSNSKILFKQGLPDPSGCEYREIHIVVNDPWENKGKEITTHGWIMPNKSSNDVKHAICWDGLIYSVVSVGDKQDIVRDITTAIQSEQSRRRNYKPYSPWQKYARDNRQLQYESYCVDYQSFLPLKLCYLLRLGYNHLADKYWEEWNQVSEEFNCLPVKDPLYTSKEKPYLMLSLMWIWNIYNRATCAYIRGDDKLALSDTKLLYKLRPILEKEIERQGFAKLPDKIKDRDLCFNPYFLDQLDVFLNDQRRRALEFGASPGYKPNVEFVANPGNISNDQTIDSLIKQLDQVSVECDMMSGMHYETDPIFGALIKKGEQAIPPLINTFKNDTRLTMTLDTPAYGLYTPFNRTVVSVSEVAYEALAAIMKTRDFNRNSVYILIIRYRPLKKPAIAENIEAYYNRHYRTR